MRIITLLVLVASLAFIFAQDTTEAPTTAAPTTAAPTAELTGTPSPAGTNPPSEENARPSSCWTCPAGFVHWALVPNAPGTDACACANPNVVYPPTDKPVVPTPRPTIPTTAANARPERCWTCPPGFVHYAFVPNAPVQTDECACLNPNVDYTGGASTPSTAGPTSSTGASSTTKAPTGSTTTSKPTDISGENNARNSAIKIAASLGAVGAAVGAAVML